MVIRSAGLLIYRRVSWDIEVLLVHPGGPFWARKDEAAWSIPKGLVEAGEDELAAAIRETAEELDIAVNGRFTPLGEYRQPGGKIVIAWSIEADPVLDVNAIQSSEFQMEWPPRSGRVKSFPEVDRAGWFSLPDAAIKLLKGQRPMLPDLLTHLERAARSY
ncbi:NUDIX domain-containing protein (plasmid) [Rhizobium leguminosarum]|jgi:predicted NUDIX family NTP pyrophosphohydrolase|uniref:NTP pyrophosphohydrolase n=2 Tax=Rhizobium leguminosarum TaxID=384 RepID=A0A1B8RI64_RHILT|nr:NUDIX domain-containing protein [Rhizobium leguminosarum]AOO88481.1 NTP pyrophosphohydrolase [Rhizobium leguminosarum bv. trifolii]ASS58694.1 NUDIX domain-containing protein [Rhizobium leguminosarum bv. viciae]MBB4330540.1 putative NUDIX family NTP pyrophosphohydrolase [Rhizobium leguminosarum]MBB4339595.1 putative NUDIX family NTP pyrophosphohydrolase [Rhizobium leguminosarum]MBB4355720.1 putative NUDIX family NTP pyrophosphohydrolase [Rhizobium leguminosarum]